MQENQPLDYDDDDLEWETLSEVRPPRRQLSASQKAYLERRKDRPQSEHETSFWRDLFRPLDWEERNVPNDEQEQGTDGSD